MSAVPLAAALSLGARATAGALFAVARSLRQVRSMQLARLAELVPELKRASAPPDALAVRETLLEHLQAAEALQIELLVPRGLRAPASRRDEAEFRAQVLALAARTQETWSALRGYLAAATASAASCEVLLSEFLMEARGLERTLAACDAMLARCHEQLQDDPAPPLAQQALALRAEDAAARVDALQLAAQAAGQVRRSAHDLQLERTALHGQLQHLARSLGGGLLERLRPVVAGEMIAPDELRAAQQARGALREALVSAEARLRRCEAMHDGLTQALAGLMRAIALWPPGEGEEGRAM